MKHHKLKSIYNINIYYRYLKYDLNQDEEEKLRNNLKKYINGDISKE